MFSERFFEIMMYITTLAVVISGLITVFQATGGGDALLGVGGNTWTANLMEWGRNVSVTQIFSIGGTNSGILGQLIDGVDWLVSAGINILIFAIALVANTPDAVRLMVMPMGLIFQMAGVGEFFGVVSLFMIAAINAAISISIIRFAILIWKGI